MLHLGILHNIIQQKTEIAILKWLFFSHNSSIFIVFSQKFQKSKFVPFLLDTPIYLPAFSPETNFPEVFVYPHG